MKWARLLGGRPYGVDRMFVFCMWSFFCGRAEMEVALLFFYKAPSPKVGSVAKEAVRVAGGGGGVSTDSVSSSYQLPPPGTCTQQPPLINQKPPNPPTYLPTFRPSSLASLSPSNWPFLPTISLPPQRKPQVLSLASVHMSFRHSASPTSRPVHLGYLECGRESCVPRACVVRGRKRRSGGMWARVLTAGGNADAKGEWDAGGPVDRGFGMCGI